MHNFEHLKYASRSDVGKKRSNNEDSHGEFPEGGIFCVSDGMGGGDDGEVASEATVKAVQSFCVDNPMPKGDAYRIEDVIFGLRSAVNTASAWVFKRATEKKLRGCGATLVGICFDASNPGEAVAFHAGDSRLYRIRGRGIKQITRDHSAAELMGVKDEKDINPMFRGMILRAVGIQPSVELESTTVQVKEGDIFLLCSDGLSKMVADKRILAIVRSSPSVKSAVDDLISAANDAGGVDNVTAVMIEVGSLPAPLPAKPLVVVPAKGAADALPEGLRVERDSDTGVEFATWDGTADDDPATATNTLATSPSICTNSTSANSLPGVETSEAIVSPDGNQATFPSALAASEPKAKASLASGKNLWGIVGVAVVLGVAIGVLFAITLMRGSSGGAEKPGTMRLTRPKAEERTVPEEETPLESKERVRLRALATSATNEIWKLVNAVEPLMGRQDRLRRADGILRSAVRSNLLDRAVNVELQKAIHNRRNWIVGAIANGCRDEIRVAGKSIAVGERYVFMFENGQCPRPWTVQRKGYDPFELPLDFDGQEVRLDEKNFVRQEVVVSIPKMPEGIVCLVDGEGRIDSVKRRPGAIIEYSYSRKGYKYVGAMKYEVKDAITQTLPEPLDSDWEFLSSQKKPKPSPPPQSGQIHPVKQTRSEVRPDSAKPEVTGQKQWPTKPLPAKPAVVVPKPNAAGSPATNDAIRAVTQPKVQDTTPALIKRDDAVKKKEAASAALVAICASASATNFIRWVTLINKSPEKDLKMPQEIKDVAQRLDGLFEVARESSDLGAFGQTNVQEVVLCVKRLVPGMLKYATSLYPNIKEDVDTAETEERRAKRYAKLISMEEFRYHAGSLKDEQGLDAVKAQLMAAGVITNSFKWAE